MARLKEIKNRIQGVKSTQKITRAMKMVAAAKLRRAQDRIISARPYAHKINQLLTDLAANAESSINEMLVPREVHTKLVVVVSSDRGLAGSFNSNLIRHGFNYVKEHGNAGNVKMLVVGKKSYDFFKKKDVDLVNSFPGIFGNLTIEVSNNIVEYIVKGYLNREFDSVVIIYNQFKSVVKQEVVTEQFLPLVKSTSKKAGKTAKMDNYIYEPSPEEIINELIPKQLRIHFWKVLLESNAAEQAARMTAMETATQNASDMLSLLSLTYNRARQAAITKEILEIVGGAEALKESM